MRHALWVALVVTAVGCSGNTTTGFPDGGANGGSAGVGASGGSGGSSGTGGSAGTGGNGGSAGTAGSAGTGGSGGSAGTAGSAGTGGSGGVGPNDGTCFAMSTASSCIECCSNNHPAWNMVADATRQCACTSPGPCASPCAKDYCQSQAGTNTCYACIFPTLAVGKACYSAAKAACGSDIDCNQYVECRAECTKLPN